MQDPKSNEGRKELNETSAETDIEPHLKIFNTVDKENNNIPQSVLKIEDAEYTDRGIYQCEVTNDDGDVVAVQSMVRVKDKYGAVYPFIGIVVEVVVLCLIIFICEKRRASKEAASAEEEEEFNGGAVGASGNSNVRHRRN